MKNTQILLFTTFLFSLIIICLTGCKKDSYKESIIGRWKLDNVIFTGTIEDGYLHLRTINYSENNIIYDFQNHNKLFVTSSISGTSQTNEYSYKCKKGNEPSCSMIGVFYIQVKIGKETFYVSVDTERETMALLKNITSENIMDETDLVILEPDNLHGYQKNFIKLK